MRVAFVLMAIAVSTTALLYDNSIKSTLFINWDLDEATEITVTQVWAWLLIGSAVAGLHPRAFAAHLVTAALMALLMCADVVQGEILPQLTPFSQASRYIAPLALALLLARPSSDRFAIATLRISAAATFAGHGARALHHDSSFADLIFSTALNLFDLEIEQGTVESTLTVIGICDLLLAALVTTGRFRWPLALMAGWGLITALSRLAQYELEGWRLVLERLPNAAVPLSAFILTPRTRSNASSEPNAEPTEVS